MEHLPFKNYMEDAVAHMMQRLAPQYPDICMCERCRTDMMMIALNNLPPRYVSTHKGDVLKRAEGMEIQYEVEVLTETMRAMQIVGGQPHHGRDEEGI
ncbi:late competence development ComFB family protein [Selenomonas dianae]|uniref:Late competence development ComFB family protein n=1 Tax=Selenomonas dianae TaxID=135079 RepID=A0ABN0TAR9_9FIRM|nr:late competence development ComFB family protein [Selenomonas dianae]WLD83540.1 late competence development ComFB family protein [Selenomonas dianae]